MSSQLHQRRTGAKDADPAHSEIQPVEEDDLGSVGAQQAAARRKTAASTGFPLAKAAGLVVTLLLAGTVLHLSRGGLPAPQNGVFAPGQLAAFDGRRGRRLYLAIMGEVYDVTPGARHYGPKGGYSFFAARDASRSYVTGKFADDLNDDVADFTPEQLSELARWRNFYRDHQEYKFVGKVAGRFYDTLGNPSALQQKVEAAAAEAAAAKAAAEAGGQAGQADAGAGSVPCNVKWSRREGGWVWCPEGQFPRRVLQADWQGGQQQERCACRDSVDVSAAARLYDGCAADAARCQTSPPEPASAAATR